MTMVTQGFFLFIWYLDVGIVLIEFILHQFLGSVDPALFPPGCLEIFKSNLNKKRHIPIAIW